MIVGWIGARLRHHTGQSLTTELHHGEEVRRQGREAQSEARSFAQSAGRWGMGDKSLDWGKGQPSVNDAGRNSAEGMKDLGGRVA